MDVRYDARNDCLERIKSAKSVIKHIIYNGLVKESKFIFCSDDDIEWNE